MSSLTGHWCHTQRAAGRARATCTCGWLGHWTHLTAAATHGLNHITGRHK